MSQAKTGNVRWPSYTQSGNMNLQSVVRPFLMRRFWDYLFKVLALIGCYVYLLKWFPSFISFSLNGEINVDFWWPLDVFLLVGTGGGINQTGIATVGLLGAAFHLRSIHRSLRNGVNVVSAVLTVSRLVMTLLVSIGMLLLYRIYFNELTFALLFGLLTLFFIGSIIFQLLDAALYRKTGASFLAFNFLIAFLYLINTTAFSKMEGVLFALLVITSAFIIILTRNRPIVIPIEAGELPRTVINERFPSIDFSWLNAWTITLSVGIILGHSLWNFLIPGFFVFEIELFVGFIILLAFGELVYKLNSKIELYFEVDAISLSRKMQAQFLSVKGIESVSKMREFFKDTSQRTQRRSMWIIYLCMFFCLLLVFVSTYSDRKMGILVALIPIFIATTSIFLSAFFSSFSGFYNFLRLTRIADIDLNINSKVYIPQNDDFSGSSELTEDRAVRIFEKLWDLTHYLSDDENDKQDLRIFIEKQGIMDHPGNKAHLIKSLLKAIIKGIPSTPTDQPMTMARAKHILWQFFKEAIIFALILVLGLTLFVALVVSIFPIKIDSQQAVFFIFGSTIIAVLSSLRENKYQDAIKCIGKYWFRKIFKTN